MNFRKVFVSVAVLVLGGSLTAAGLAPSNAAITIPHQQRMLGITVPIMRVTSEQALAAETQLDAAEAELGSSLNHTLADNTRGALTVDIQSGRQDLATAMSDLSGLGATFDPGAKTSNTKMAALAAGAIRDFRQLATDESTLSSAQSAVTASMTARSKQLAAQALAARRAASGAYHEVVWTSGFQAQIDACRGAVNLTPTYHVAVIGEEWQCGGARFPRAGALVRLSGVINGLYRVGPVVAVLNAYVDKTRDIPRGYALLYQTCRNGNAHTETFTELIPVRS